MAAPQKVAVAGSSGNLAPTVVKALVSSGFAVTVLSRGTTKPDHLPDSVNYTTVDYNSHDSLVSALKGQEALICMISNHGDQPPLIDAAIAAGVKHYIPSEFGSNVLGNEKTAALPVFAGKAKTEEHLKKKSNEISWTVIVNGGFLDWGVKVGFLVNLQGGKTRIIDDGDAKHSFTNIDDIAKAVVGVLKHPEETKNRAVYVQSAASSQNELLALAKEANPQVKTNTEPISGDELLKESYELLKKGGENIRPAMVGFIHVSLFVDGYGNNWEDKNDNALLGIEELSHEQLKSVVAQYA